MPLALDRDPVPVTEFIVIIFILYFFFRFFLGDIQNSAKRLHREGAAAFLLPTTYANDTVAAPTL
jgi:hypothetical protein